MELVGYAGRSHEKTVKMAFVSGFPDCIPTELQELTGIENMEVEEVLKHASVLAKRSESGAVVAESRSKFDVKERTMKKPIRKFIGKCWRDCKEPRPDITCFWCSQVGHISRHYPPPQGNE